MGDRCNIVIQDQGNRVFLYGHWCGHEAPEIVRVVLARKQRWDDPSYLARIIFCRMISGNENGETGFGISTTIGDNSYPLLIVDCDRQVVRIEEASGGSFRGQMTEEYGFAAYAALEAATWGNLDAGRKDDDE